ncbi:hypothetical protein BD779DRAFT_274248 [Infundibulicybe gibba]|nr:hypothetical protein BD779DRAFT_274248 [Infundibulicybe gibba]
MFERSPVSMLTKDNGLPDLDPECLNGGTDACSEFIGNAGYLAFWTLYKAYLSSRGYTLYEAIPWRTHLHFRPLSLYPPPPAHPYAVACYDSPKPLNTIHPSGLRFYAQDSSHRDVVIRLVGNDTEEYQIHTLLSACTYYVVHTIPPPGIPILHTWHAHLSTANHEMVPAVCDESSTTCRPCNRYLSCESVRSRPPDGSANLVCSVCVYRPINSGP